MKSIIYHRFTPFAAIVWIMLFFLVGCKSLSQRETSAVNAFNQGNTLRSEGRLKDAITYYRQALNSKPDMAGASFNLAITLTLANMPSDAMTILQELHERDQNNLRVLRAMGWTSWNAGSPENGLKYYKLALDVSPGDVESLQGMVRILESQKNFAAAIEYQTTLLWLKESLENRISLASLLHSAGNYQEALQYYQRIIYDGAADGTVFVDAGMAAKILGLKSTAIEYFRQASQLSGDHQADAWFFIAQLMLVEIFDYVQGFEALEAAIALGFNDRDALDALLTSVPQGIQDSVRSQLIAPE